MEFKNFTLINTQGDLFNLEFSNVSYEGMASIWINPYNDDLKSEYHTVDMMNETVIGYFKSEGFRVLHNGILK